jgi:quercetin dioxygenase-like cupin family protein
MTASSQIDENLAQMPVVAYVRIYTGSDGHSYFEDVKPHGETRGTPESDLQATFGELLSVDTAIFRHVVREADDRKRHNAPRPQFIIVLKGECEVETSLGDTRRFGPGDILLAEDVAGLGHVTRRIGDQERLTMVVTLQTGS